MTHGSLNLRSSGMGKEEGDQFCFVFDPFLLKFRRVPAGLGWKIKTIREGQFFRLWMGKRA